LIYLNSFLLLVQTKRKIFLWKCCNLFVLCYFGCTTLNCFPSRDKSTQTVSVFIFSMALSIIIDCNRLFLYIPTRMINLGSYLQLSITIGFFISYYQLLSIPVWLTHSQTHVLFQ